MRTKPLLSASLTETVFGRCTVLSNLNPGFRSHGLCKIGSRVSLSIRFNFPDISRMVSGALKTSFRSHITGSSAQDKSANVSGTAIFEGAVKREDRTKNMPGVLTVISKFSFTPSFISTTRSKNITKFKAMRI